jgi:hypothetical protein
MSLTYFWLHEDYFPLTLSLSSIGGEGIKKKSRKAPSPPRSGERATVFFVKLREAAVGSSEYDF